MKKALMTILLGGLFSTGMALAHSGGEHVMGTVKSIDASSLAVETKDKKTVAVHVDDKTAYEKSGAAASAKDLKVGERVVVHAMKHGEMLHATLVKFGTQTKPGTSTHGEHNAGTSDAGTAGAGAGSHDHSKH